VREREREKEEEEEEEEGGEIYVCSKNRNSNVLYI